MKNFHFTSIPVMLIKAFYRQMEKMEKLYLLIKTLPAWTQTGTMDSKELCKLLHIKQNTLYKLTKKYGIPYRKVGHRNFYKMEEVEECLFKSSKVSFSHS